MEFAELVKAALELGVIPTLALFLVVAMFLQNKQLTRDRRIMEERLLNTIAQVLADYQKLISQAHASKPRLEPRTSSRSLEEQLEDSSGEEP